ncbi:MAG TPA: hypothetical protein ENN09_05980 [Planctomycetes bacterium]|nr:hypothetical protein [Planctomycetota bacterium]
MKEKVVLVGAGSAMFTRGLVADIIRQKWEGEIALVDVSSDALGIAEGLTRKMLQAGKSQIRLTASTDRREVLKGATAVITTIGVGGRRAWEQDVFVPRKFGIYQPVGDSVMPGGTSRALRMIPALVDIAKDVHDLAPDALFFNYSNPMSPVCRGVRKATGANIIGLCHGVFHVGHYLEDVLELERNSLNYTAVGMNHLTWFVEMSVGGKDMMPALMAEAKRRTKKHVDAEKLGKRFEEAGTSGRGDAVPTEDNPFSWRLCLLFGAFPAVLDRHVAEFFPWMFSAKGAYYGGTLGVDGYSIEAVIANGDRIFDEMRKTAHSKKPLNDDFLKSTSGEHEQVTDIIRNIRSGAGTVYSANLPNRGQAPNLPYDAVIECPAIASGGALKAIQQKPLKPAIAGTLASRFQWVETVVEAALEGSRDKFVQALILDGSVTSVEIAEKLADDLLAAQAEYLPQFKRNGGK